MAKDPVCGMDVDPKRAAGTSIYKGETIYFCNPHCKERFDADPAAFMGTKSGTVGTDFKSVPMPQIGEAGRPHETAKDPICGMVVDKNRSLKKEMAGRMYYFCSEGCVRTFEAPEEELKSMKWSGNVLYLPCAFGCHCQ